MSDKLSKEDMILKAMTKLLKQMKEMNETLQTMSESVDLLVRIEKDKIEQGD